ncbi:MAG: hypothetical protein ACREPR_24860 [Brasilonema sp.]
MTLDKHKIQGLAAFTCKVVDSQQFEKMMLEAGYSISGSAPAQANRIKIWWIHDEFPKVESIYTPDRKKVITAYHV